jgi:hypothetical protein
LGGAAASSVGTIKNSGGAGGNATNFASGPAGGGGAAGPLGNGAAGGNGTAESTWTTAGPGGGGGGAATDGANVGSNGGNGAACGGGGGGASTSTAALIGGNGGNGGAGCIILTWTPVGGGPPHNNLLMGISYEKNRGDSYSNGGGFDRDGFWIDGVHYNGDGDPECFIRSGSKSDCDSDSSRSVDYARLLAALRLHGTPASGGSVPVVSAATLYTYSPATSTQAVGTVTATNSPTSWAITGGNSAGDFAISSGGAITVTSQGQTDLTGATAAVAYTLTVTATNASGTSTGQSIPITVYADGFAGAPTCSVQFATLLNGYHTGGAGAGRAKGNGYQPPWNVAGVDYCVGLPSGLSLTAASAISMSGVTVDASGHNITVNTATSVTLDKIDYTGNGGWGVVISSSNTGSVTLSNSNFAVGANAKPMLNIQNGAAGPLLIKATTFTGSGGADQPFNGGIYCNSGSTMSTTIMYSYMNNFDEDFWDGCGNNTGIFNVWYNNAQANNTTYSTPHPDWLQLSTGPEGAQNMTFSLYYNNSHGTAVGGSQGLGFYAAGPGSYSLDSVNTSYNTMIAGSSAGVNYMISINLSGQVTGGGNGSLTGAAVVSNNYVDVSGVSVAFAQTLRTLTGGATYSQTGNINMSTGGAMNCQNAVTCMIDEYPHAANDNLEYRRAAGW